MAIEQNMPLLQLKHLFDVLKQIQEYGFLKNAGAVVKYRNNT